MGNKKIVKKVIKKSNLNNNKVKEVKEIDEREKQVFKRVLVKFRQY
jgi:hypothetical protein